MSAAETPPSLITELFRWAALACWYVFVAAIIVALLCGIVLMADATLRELVRRRGGRERDVRRRERL
jgi:hypothetical protein